MNEIEKLIDYMENGGKRNTKEWITLFEEAKPSLIEKARRFYPDAHAFTTNVLVYFVHHESPDFCPECSRPCDLNKAGTPFKSYCSKECSFKGRAKVYEKNMLAKHGVKNASQLEEVKESRKRKLLDTYGVDNVMKLGETVEKRKKTFEESGRTGPLSSEEAKAKHRETCLERYGFENAASNEEVKRRRMAALEEMGGEKRSQIATKGWETRKSKRKDLYKKLDDRTWLREKYESGLTGHEIAADLEIHGQTVYNRLKDFGIPLREGITESAAQREIAEYVRTLGFDVLTSEAGLFQENTRLEIDVYVPTEGFGIEYNGLHWHNRRTKDRNYHKRKRDYAQNTGINLYSIWEDDWLHPTKKEIIKRAIASKLGVRGKGIFARKCSFESFVQSDISEWFLDHNHIQGAAKGVKNSGLVMDGELKAVLSYRISGNVLNIVRYASDSVVGGFSKILKNVLATEIGVECVITFADRMTSDGSLYEKNGFFVDGVTKPNYWYTESHYRVNKQHFRRDKLKRLKFFDPSLSERENAEANGFYQIFDAGLVRYKKYVSR